MRAALLALAIGIIVGVGAALQFGMPRGEKATTPAIGGGKSTAPDKSSSAPAPAVVAAPPPAVANASAAVAPPPPGTPITAVPDFASLAERLSPVVVNISSRSQRKEPSDVPRFRGPGGQGPQWPFG